MRRRANVFSTGCPKKQSGNTHYTRSTKKVSIIINARGGNCTGKPWVTATPRGRGDRIMQPEKAGIEKRMNSTRNGKREKSLPTRGKKWYTLWLRNQKKHALMERSVARRNLKQKGRRGEKKMQHRKGRTGNRLWVHAIALPCLIAGKNLTSEGGGLNPNKK